MRSAMANKKKEVQSLLKKLFQNSGESGTQSGAHKKKNPSMQYLLIILSIGIVLMLLGNIFGPEKTDQPEAQPASSDGQTEQSKEVFKEKKSSSPSTMIEYAEYYENQLREILEDINGVGDVTVSVTIGSTEKTVVGKNTSVQSQSTKEQDQEGGTRKQEQQSREEDPVIIGGSEGDQPLIVGKEKPEITGVGIVAEGADNVQVEAWLKETVSRTLGVPAYKISIAPKKTKGE
jgi:stage III sporulation protein AG